MQTKEIKTIETYSLYEFCKAVQEAVQEGYVFDFDSNDLFPQAFGSLMTAGMIKHNEVKQEAQSEPEQVPEVQAEEKPVAKAASNEHGSVRNTRKPRG